MLLCCVVARACRGVAVVLLQISTCYYVDTETLQSRASDAAGLLCRQGLILASCAASKLVFIWNFCPLCALRTVQVVNIVFGCTTLEWRLSDCLNHALVAPWTSCQGKERCAPIYAAKAQQPAPAQHLHCTVPSTVPTFSYLFSWGEA